MRYKKILFLILGAKILATVFTVVVYSQITPLTDAENYLNYGIQSEGSFGRSAITESIFSYLNTLVGSELLVSLLATVICGFTIWYCLLRFFGRMDMLLFWACFLLPHFLIRAGYAGKEIIAVTGFFVLIRYIGHRMDGQNPSLLLHLPPILLAFLVRPHYGLAYAWLLIATWILYGDRRGSVYHVFVHAFPVLATGIIALIVFVMGSYLYDVFTLTLSTAERYFLASGKAAMSRYWLELRDITDFVVNMWWGIPTSIIGPLPQDLLQRQILIPVFFEGLAAIFLAGYLLVRCVRVTAHDRHHRRFVFMGLLPAVAIALLIHYPFGVFNPGAAIRYKQNIAPLLYFVPLVFLAIAEAKGRVRSVQSRRAAAQGVVLPWPSEAGMPASAHAPGGPAAGPVAGPGMES